MNCSLTYATIASILYDLISSKNPPINEPRIAPLLSLTH